MQDRSDFRTRLDGQPQPQDAAVAAQPRSQLIQLKRGKLEMIENVFVQGLSARDNQVVMVACREPKTRSAADGSNPSASAASTMAT